MTAAHDLPRTDGERAQSGTRIGVVGADLPRQIVLASGAVPERLFGSWSGAVSPRASELLGAVDDVAGRILDSVLAGEHDDLAGLVICNDSQANLRMFYVLRVLADRGEVPFPVQLLDAPRGSGAAKETFIVAQYTRLIDFCRRVTGAEVGVDALRRAGHVEQSIADALERMRGRRVEGRCAGSSALDAYRVAASAEPKIAVETIDRAQSPVGQGDRVFVTGSGHPDSSVYREIERTGVIIVAEDHDSGDAGWFAVCTEGESEADILAVLASLHAARPPSAARGATAERVAALSRRAAETRSDAVMALVRELDDAPAWEVPAIRHALDAVPAPFASRVRIPPEGALSAARDLSVALMEKDGAHR